MQYCVETILLQKRFFQNSLEGQNEFLNAVVCKMQDLIQFMSS